MDPVLPRFLAAGLTLALVLSGCASAPRSIVRTAAPTPASVAVSVPAPVADRPAPHEVDTAALIARDNDHQKVGRPYVVGGQSFVPQREDDYDRVGIASWYGPTFHGRATANGEIFDQNLMTAAHTTLPIPSIVEVTNLENGRQIVVRLNDRGPFVDDRLIDLSRAAADQLGYLSRGLARVRVRYLGPAWPGAGAPEHGYQLAQTSAMPSALTEVARAEPVEVTDDTPAWADVTVQAGAFGELANANRFAAQIAAAGPVSVEAGDSDGMTVYRVFVGPWLDRAAAEAARGRLADLGVYGARIVAPN